MIEITDSPDITKWSEFVYNHPHGNIFQTPDMAKVYERTENYEPISLAVIDTENDEILALVQAVVITEMSGMLGSFSARSIINGGPLFIEGEKGIAALKNLMEHYDKFVRKKAIYTQIRNMWDTTDISNILKNAGYQYEEHLNFLIDLNKSREELWSNLSKKRRNGIRRAEKRGVIIKEIKDKSLIFLFYDVLQETYRNAKLPLADISLFESAFDILASKNMVKFFLAKHKDKNIGAIVVLIYNGIIYDWYAGASIDYLRLYPNDILPWYVMEWGSDYGYRAFDFGGAGKPNEEYGVRDFKKQFGGELLNYGRYKKIHSPIKMNIGKMGYELWKKVR